MRAIHVAAARAEGLVGDDPRHVRPHLRNLFDDLLDPLLVPHGATALGTGLQRYFRRVVDLRRDGSAISPMPRLAPGTLLLGRRTLLRFSPTERRRLTGRLSLDQRQLLAKPVIFLPQGSILG